tara:strand:+ start:512 stop:1477 length:966 start_codon:yes stop_codon:yes gene_type:complete
MKNKIILIVVGEPYSTFSEIIGKYFSKVVSKKLKIVLIGNYQLIHDQLKKLKYKIKIHKIDKLDYARKNGLNLINIKFKYKKIFDEISDKSNKYLTDSFDKAIEILKANKDKILLINGPISKKSFLKKKYLGITEYLSKKTKSKNEVMLIYNHDLSVSPITTHIPLKNVTKNITKKKIVNNVITINNFYKRKLKKKANFAILGLNPHCETVDKFSEEDKIITPAIKILRNKGVNIKGPFSADTFFLNDNLKKFNVVIGMYHDQVLAPIKTLYNFNAINLTLGLPFLRISPDHGPNSKMLGKNKSDPSSFFYAMRFISKLRD